MTARLAAGFWVRAYLARLQQAGIPVYVTAHGDETAGTVAVKLATLDGRARAFGRSYDPLSGARVWVVLADGPETEVDAVLARARHRDPDIWIIEIEDRAGRHLLDEDGLAE